MKPDFYDLFHRRTQSAQIHRIPKKRHQEQVITKRNNFDEFPAVFNDKGKQDAESMQSQLCCLRQDVKSLNYQ